MNEKYTPYGPEWESQMMKLPKKFLIAQLRNICLEQSELSRITDAMCQDLRGWQESLGGPSERTQQLIHDYRRMRKP